MCFYNILLLSLAEMGVEPQNLVENKSSSFISSRFTKESKYERCYYSSLVFVFLAGAVVLYFIVPSGCLPSCFVFMCVYKAG